MAFSRIMFLLFCTFLCFVQSMNHNPPHTPTTEEDIIVIPTAQLVGPNSTDVAVAVTAQVIEQPPAKAKAKVEQPPAKAKAKFEQPPAKAKAKVEQPPAKAKAKVEQPPKGPRYYIYRANSDCFLGFHVQGSNPDADHRISEFFQYSPPMKNTFRQSYTWCGKSELQEWTMEPKGNTFDLVAQKTTWSVTYKQININKPRKILTFLKPKVKTIKKEIKHKHVQTFRIEGMWKSKAINWKTESNWNGRQYLIKSPNLYMLGKGSRFNNEGENYLWDSNKFVPVKKNPSRFTQGYIIQKVQPGLKEKLLQKIKEKAEKAAEYRKEMSDMCYAMNHGNGFSW